VVGSGAGGGPLAARLAEAGFVVGLIEAGQNPQQEWFNVPVLHAFASEHPDISWEFFVKHYTDENRSKRDKNKYFPDKGGVFYPRAGTLGGCTQHHAMITVYPHNSDWQHIADLTGDSSWAPEKMRAYFEKLERCDYKTDPAARHGTNGWLTTKDLDLTIGLGDPAVVQTVFKAIKTAWLEGFSGVLPDLPQDPNDWRTPRFEGVAFAPLATLKGSRAGARDRILGVVQKFPKKLIVKYSNLATKVLFDGRRAIGVECLEGSHLYRADPNSTDAVKPEVKKYYCAREVILAGGAFNSPQLLMLSGIGPAAHLKEFNIQVVVDRKGVGTNLQDRYEVSVVSEMKSNWKIIEKATFAPPITFNDTGDPCYQDWRKGAGVYTTNGSLLAVIKKSFPDRPDPDLFMFALAGKFEGYYPGYSKDVERTKNYLTWLVLKAHTENTAGYVRLKSADPRDRPEINMRYFDDPVTAKRDLDAIVEGVRFVRKVSKHNTAIKGEVLPGADKVATDDQVRQFVQDNAWGHHASCSNPMGRPDDPNAVVDSNFRVIGVDNLRVVDASVFPRIPGFFIVTPIYMIAEKAADVIVAHAQQHQAVSVSNGP
jgi:choline dehydrogenase